jgi:G:T-mismatch repair DNA endonuclease (very short patch repair protein)
MALRRALHRCGLRFVVDRPVPGGNRRRRVDILLPGARIAVFVDGCFWHSCPEHSHLPKTNTSGAWSSVASPVATATPTPNSPRQAGSPSGSGSTRIRSKRHMR